MGLSTRAAVVVIVVVACWCSCTHAVAVCSAGETSTCYSCTATGTCEGVNEGDPVMPVMLCRNGQVCDIVRGMAQCVNMTGTLCECTPFTFSCDAYDPTGVTACFIDESISSEFIPHVVHTCEVPMECSEGQCVDPTATTTTTTTTSTTKPETCSAANSNTRYPHEDCKKYYTCREIKRGVYGYVTSTCPSTLVYNSDENYCDLPTNVPNCPQ